MLYTLNNLGSKTELLILSGQAVVVGLRGEDLVRLGPKRDVQTAPYGTRTDRQYNFEDRCTQLLATLVLYGQTSLKMPSRERKQSCCGTPLQLVSHFLLLKSMFKHFKRVYHFRNARRTPVALLGPAIYIFLSKYLSVSP